MASIALLVGHPTRKGPVFIGRSQDGRFHVLWNEEDLGGYSSLQAAVSEVAGGHTDWPSSGVDPSTLGISDDPADWLPARDLR